MKATTTVRCPLILLLSVRKVGPVHSCLSVPPAVKAVKKVLTSEVQQYIYIYIYGLVQFGMRSEVYSILSEI